MHLPAVVTASCQHLQACIHWISLAACTTCCFCEVVKPVLHEMYFCDMMYTAEKVWLYTSRTDLSWRFSLTDVAFADIHSSAVDSNGERLAGMQTYKLESSITGARCVQNQARLNRLLIAGIAAAGVLSLSLLLSAIMFFRYILPILATCQPSLTNSRSQNSKPEYQHCPTPVQHQFALRLTASHHLVAQRACCLGSVNLVTGAKTSPFKAPNALQG